MKRAARHRPASHREIQRELERCEKFDSEGRMMTEPMLQVSVYREMLLLYAQAHGHWFCIICGRLQSAKAEPSPQYKDCCKKCRPGTGKVPADG